MFYLSPVGDQWTVAGMAVPHAIVWYLLFGITTVWWMAPAYAAMSDIIAANRRATALAIFNLGLTMVGSGLGPLMVGILSDALTPLHGNESLRAGRWSTRCPPMSLVSHHYWLRSGHTSGNGAVWRRAS